MTSILFSAYRRVLSFQSQVGFHKLDENGNIDMRFFTMWNSSNRMLTQFGIKWGTSDMQVWSGHPAGSLNDSDKCDSIERFLHGFLRGITMAVYEIIVFTFFK